MSTERDTHFRHFAELVAQELREQDLLDIGNHIKPLVDPPVDFDYEKVKTLIAQRAYDLVKYASECINDTQLEEGMRLTSEYMLEVIPDLISWPEET